MSPNIPSIGGVTNVVVTIACITYWVGPPLCSCVCHVRNGVCSLVFGVGPPKSVSYLCFWYAVWGTWGWSIHTGRESVSIHLLELFICECTLPCQLSSAVQALRLNSGWHCSQPHLNCGYASNCPWWLLDFVFIKATSIDPQKPCLKTEVIINLDPLWVPRGQWHRSHPTSSPLLFPSFFLSSYSITQGTFLSFQVFKVLCQCPGGTLW